MDVLERLYCALHPTPYTLRSLLSFLRAGNEWEATVELGTGWWVPSARRIVVLDRCDGAGGGASC